MRIVLAFVLVIAILAGEAAEIKTTCNLSAGDLVQCMEDFTNALLNCADKPMDEMLQCANEALGSLSQGCQDCICAGADVVPDEYAGICSSSLGLTVSYMTVIATVVITMVLNMY